MPTAPVHPLSARLRGPARWLAAGLFVAAGVTHFARPEWFVRIVPPQLPSPSTLVLVSGVAEVAGGLGLLPSQTRRAAGWGLVVLLVAVFPANIYMAVRADRFGDVGPAWAMWARLPLQGVLIAWVAWAGGLIGADDAARPVR